MDKWCNGDARTLKSAACKFSKTCLDARLRVLGIAIDEIVVPLAKFGAPLVHREGKSVREYFIDATVQGGDPCIEIAVVFQIEVIDLESVTAML